MVLNLIEGKNMERFPSTPPTIKPLNSMTQRPNWSVMIPAYNCSKFLPETIESVLAQNISPKEMQIEVVDDASTDADVEALVRQVGKGRVSYYRQPQNMGSLRNFETCINRAKGHLVHILHGDDRIINGYYTSIQALFEEYPEAGAAFCRHHSINEEGKVISGQSTLEMPQAGLLENWLLRIGEGQRLQYVTITVKREVYERLGSFCGKTYGEDWEMWVRIAKHYPVAYTPNLLAEYRQHADSISNMKIMSGEHLKDITYIIQAIQDHLPPECRKKVLRSARKNFAYYGLWLAQRLWRTSHNKDQVLVNLKNILRLHLDARLCYHSAKLLARMTLKEYKNILKKT